MKALVIVLGAAAIAAGVIVGLRTAPRNEAGFYTGPAMKGGAPAGLMAGGVFLVVLGLSL